MGLVPYAQVVSMDFCATSLVHSYHFAVLCMFALLETRSIIFTAGANILIILVFPIGVPAQYVLIPKARILKLLLRSGLS